MWAWHPKFTRVDLAPQAEALPCGKFWVVNTDILDILIDAVAIQISPPLWIRHCLNIITMVSHSSCCIHSKHETLKHCCLNDGPPSATLVNTDILDILIDAVAIQFPPPLWIRHCLYIINMVSHSSCCIHSKHETLRHCWLNDGPPSATLVQHWANNKWLSPVFRLDVQKYYPKPLRRGDCFYTSESDVWKN